MAVAVEVVEVVGGRGEVNDEGAEGRRDQLPRGARGEIVGGCHDDHVEGAGGGRHLGRCPCRMGTTAGAAVRCVGVGGRYAGIATHRRALLWNYYSVGLDPALPASSLMPHDEHNRVTFNLFQPLHGQNNQHTTLPPACNPPSLLFGKKCCFMMTATEGVLKKI